jgi:hypothetical protein
MDAFLHLCESSTIRPISVIKPLHHQEGLLPHFQSSKTEWVAVFDDGSKLRFGTRNDNRKQRFIHTLVQKYGADKVIDFSRKYPLEFAV